MASYFTLAFLYVGSATSKILVDLSDEGGRVVDWHEMEGARFELLQRHRGEVHRGQSKIEEFPVLYDEFPVTPRSYEDEVPPEAKAPYFPEPPFYERSRTVQSSSPTCKLPIVSWLNETFPDDGTTHEVEIFDVGGGSGDTQKLVEERLNQRFSWSCVDVTATDVCEAYPGDHLRMPPRSKDVLMFVNNLHHIRDSVLYLLEDAAQIARKYVLVLDLMHGENFDEAFATFTHEWEGLYRSVPEWEKLFQLLGYRIVFKQEPEYLCGPIRSKNVMWILEPPDNADKAM